MTQKQYSIVEARNQLANLVHQVEATGPVTLTRRGKPVAVLIAEAGFERLQGIKTDFWTAAEQFRAKHALAESGADFDTSGMRDKSAGRRPPW
jgi:prevent-host-death family protein